MSERPLPSPCISVCSLDAQDICIGCLRSGKEIIQWGKMTNDERRQVYANIAEREAQRQK